MKNHLLLLGLVFLPIIGFSQEYEYVPFPDSGAIWSEVYQPPINIYGNFPPPIYERFTLNGEDTIINEFRYKKLYISFDSVYNKSKATYIGGIREDENKRIFFKGDTVLHDFKPMIEFYNYEEILLYDFSLNINDTIWEGNYPKGANLVVKDIDSVVVGGVLRKEFTFENRCCVKWIEGIGNLQGLLFTSGALPTNGLNGDLICFKKNNNIIYFNNDYLECFPMLTDINVKINDYANIKLYPNPSSKNSIKFSFSDNQFKLIQIIDCNGYLCDWFNIQLQSEFFLLTEKYKPGIYFYKAINKVGIVYTGKFVVQ